MRRGSLGPGGKDSRESACGACWKGERINRLRVWMLEGGKDQRLPCIEAETRKEITVCVCG